jgi:hypothetical protein
MPWEEIERVPGRGAHAPCSRPRPTSSCRLIQSINVDMRLRHRGAQHADRICATVTHSHACPRRGRAVAYGCDDRRWEWWVACRANAMWEERKESSALDALLCQLEAPS